MDSLTAFRALLSVPVGIYEAKYFVWPVLALAAAGLLGTRLGWISQIPKPALVGGWWFVTAIGALVAVTLVAGYVAMPRDGASFIYLYSASLASLPILIILAVALFCKP